MCFFDFLTGTRRPDAGVPARPGDEVFALLLGVNGPDKPYLVRRGGPEEVDLVAEWRITERDFASMFRNTRMDRTYQVLMMLDPVRHEVRTVERQWKVTWVDGRAQLTLAKEYDQGPMREVSWQKTVERGPDGKFTTTTDFHFSTQALKEPLRHAVLGAGWTWKSGFRVPRR